jgi:hypothetical protein
MSKSIRPFLIATASALLLLVGSAALAEEDGEGKSDLNDYLCKDLMRLSGCDRENALAVVHGYRLGKKGTTQFQVDELSALTDKFIEYCLDHPDDKALEAFEKLAK